MSGRLGYHIISVEPQPHCVQYIKAATALNGIAGALEVGKRPLTSGAKLRS